MKSKKLSILILSNNTSLYFKEKLIKFYKKININVNVEEIYYDEIRLIGRLNKKYDLVLFFYDLIAVNNFFITFYDSHNEKFLRRFEKKFYKDLQSLKKIFPKTQKILINNFYDFNLNISKKKNFEKLIINLNNFVDKNFNQNFEIIDLKKIFKKYGLFQLIDFSKFISAKILYSNLFVDEYIEQIKFYLTNKTIYKKKLIILDGDNTLWKGIVGDDGVNIIKNNNENKLGIFYLEAQKIFKFLKNRGVLLAICSKNEFKDVKKLFDKNRNHWPLKFSDFVVKKINWKNKVNNIVEITNELNIGLESVIFLDDSKFEYNLVKKQLKKITCFQVPEKIENYQNITDSIKSFFDLKNLSKDSTSKTDQYFKEFERKKLKIKTNNLETYLSKLNTKIILAKKKDFDYLRASEMTLKYNQFNFLTKRFDVEEIKNFHKKNLIYLFKVKDHYGDYGYVGLIMLRSVNNKNVILENFMLSCRVFDRFIEHRIIKLMISNLSKKFNNLEVSIILTEKNKRFFDFFDNLGLKCIEENNYLKKYNINLKSNKIKYPKIINHIKTS